MENEAAKPEVVSAPVEAAAPPAPPEKEPEYFEHSPDTLAEHIYYVDTFIKCTKELLGMDSREKKIEKSVALERVTYEGKTPDAPETFYSCYLPPSPDLENALNFGCRSVIFTTTDAQGQPMALRLPPSVKNGEEPGEVLIKLLPEMTNNNYEGKLEIRPAGANELTLDMLEMLKAHPENYPIETAVQLFNLKESDMRSFEGEYVAKAPLNEGQLEALKMCLANRATLVWGPPGTGKSHLICQIMDAFLERDLDITLIASTNYAIDSVSAKLRDVGIAQADSSVGVAYRDLKITRYGTPDRPRSLDMIAYMNRRATSKKENKEDDLPTQGATMETDVVSIATGFRFISNRGEEVDENLGSLPIRDAMIIDEVSTVNLPWIYIAACFAREKIVVVGDQRQLSVIYPYKGGSAATRGAYEKTIFAYLQMRLHDAKDGRGLDRRMSVLVEQRRMPDDLAENVRLTGLYPAYLTPVDYKPSPVAKVAIDAGPQPGKQFVIINTATYRNPTTQNNVNSAHLDLTKRLINYYLSIPKMGRLGVICPYRNQVSEYKKWLHSGQKGKRRDKNTEHASFGTVHSYQGSEAPLIIWDTVESPVADGSEAHHFFTDELKHDRGQGLNLMNVAVSRSQGKFILLVNVPYVMANFTSGCFLQKLIRRGVDQQRIMTAEEVIESLGLRESAPVISVRFPGLPFKVPASELYKTIEADLAFCRDFVALRSPEVNPQMLLTVVNWFYQKSIEKNITIEFYTRQNVTKDVRTLFEKLIRHNNKFRWQPLSKWDYGSKDIVVDKAVFYSGVPSLLSGDHEQFILRQVEALS